VFTKWAAPSSAAAAASVAAGKAEEAQQGEPEYLAAPAGYSAGKVAKHGLEDFPASLRLQETEEAEEQGEPWELPHGDDYSKRHFNDDSALNSPESFEAREEFAGGRQGFVYRLGSLGLGYYLDVKKAAA
jgi:hypothetical protein